MGKPSNDKVYEFQEFRLNAADRMLYRGDEELGLAPRAIETLLALIERRGEIVSKEALMKAIWADSIVEESNLAQYLHVLRKTLGNREDGRPLIETLRRRGYRFTGEVKVSDKRSGSLKETVAMPVVEAASRSIRVERRGNVLAVADWAEVEAETSLEPTTAPTLSGSGSKWSMPRLAVATAMIAIAVVTSLLLWSRLAPEKASAKGDLSFTTLTAGADVNFASISPDGNYFAYSSNDGGRGHLWVQQTEQMNPVEITEAIRGTIIGTTWTPNSRHVYFVVDEEDREPHSLYRVPALGGTRTKILSDIAAQVSFSPDGSEMVFMRASVKERKGSVVIAASDGSNERVLLTRTLDENLGLNGGGSWSPDGKTVAYGLVDTKQPWTGGCTIVGTDVASGETRPLSNEKWDTCLRMEWTKDSKGLVFVGTRANEAYSTRRDQIYYLSLDTGESRRLTTEGNRHQSVSLGVTEKDEVLAVPFNRLSQIWSMDASGDSRTAKQITTGFADGRGGIAPLADGRVSFLTRHGDGFSIWLMNGDGTARRQLTSEPPNIEEIRAAPDGSFFVFSAKGDGYNHIFRAGPDGGDLRQLTFGETQNVDSSISPNGDWIVYDSTRNVDGAIKTRLFRIRSSGGEPEAFSDADCANPHFSPDGRFVSCVASDWKTGIILDAESGQVRRSFKTEPNCVLNIGVRWLPDSSGLVYIVNRGNVSNLVQQPLDSGAPTPLTDFTSGEIYNFSFSSDGNTLFLARGYSTRNAVLIRNFR